MSWFVALFYLILRLVKEQSAQQIFCVHFLIERALNILIHILLSNAKWSLWIHSDP